jgi:pSer/pThr/pTyr-binding forkhead associated (FHA) protein
MAKLILMRDGESQIEYLIGAHETVIGRTQDNDITISDDAVSRHHIRIICILGDCFMEDLGSANGTMLNQRLTKKSPLQDGDVLTIGRHHMKYVVTPGDVAASKEDYDKTRLFLMKQLSDDDGSVATAESMELSSNKHQDGGGAAAEREADPEVGTETEVVEPEPPESPPRIYAESPNGRSGKLTLISGSNSGVTLPLIKDVTGISRSGKRIAAITRRTHGYFLVPLEVGEPDHAAVKVNGEPVGRKIYPLCSNDIVEFGEMKMEFSFA